MTSPDQTSALPETASPRTAVPETGLPKSWDPAEHEASLYQGWVDAGYFTADPASAKPAYSIVLPPPNVTGSLHMGHALDHTLMDALTRRKRMQGFEVLWLPGMDHAGIATQSVVEKGLRAEGSSRHELGREAFVERVWEWKAEYGSRIVEQYKRLGASCDYERERWPKNEAQIRWSHWLSRLYALEGPLADRLLTTAFRFGDSKLGRAIQGRIWSHLATRPAPAGSPIPRTSGSPA